MIKGVADAPRERQRKRTVSQLTRYSSDIQHDIDVTVTSLSSRQTLKQSRPNAQQVPVVSVTVCEVGGLPGRRRSVSVCNGRRVGVARRLPLTRGADEKGGAGAVVVGVAAAAAAGSSRCGGRHHATPHCLAPLHSVMSLPGTV